MDAPLTALSPLAARTEYRSILATLAGIRTRLYLTRLAERSTLALIVAALVGINLLFATFLFFRYPILAHVVAALPLVAAPAALWVRFERKVPAYPFAVALAAVAGTLAFLVLMHTSFRPQIAPWMIPAGAAIACLAATLVTTRPVDTRASAIFVDHQVGLKERVSTALEWAGMQPASPLEDAFRGPLVQSAIAACKTVHGARVGYGRLDRRAYAVAATCIIAAIAATQLEPLPAPYHPAYHANIVAIRAGNGLEKALAAIQKEKPDEKVDPILQKNPADALRPLATALKQGDMSNLEALGEVNKVRETLADALGKQDAGKLANEALAGSQSDAAKRLTDASDALRDAQMKAAQGDAGAASALEAARQQMQDAANAAGNKLASGQMSAKEKADLKAALAGAAGKSGGDPQLKDALNRAAKAADGGNASDLAQGLQDAGNQMAKDGASSQLSGKELRDAMAAADSAASQLGGSSEANAGGSNSGAGESGQPGSEGGAQANSGSGQQPDGSGQRPGGGGQQPAGGGDQAGGPAGGGQPPGGGESGAAGGGMASADTGSSAGNGPMDPGDGGGGSTNFEGRSGPGGKHHGEEVGRAGQMVKLYEATPIANAGEAHQGSVVLNKGAAAGTTEVKGVADRNTGSIVTYDSQLPALNQMVNDSLNRNQIPAQYRDLIHAYFDDRAP